MDNVDLYSSNTIQGIYMVRIYSSFMVDSTRLRAEDILMLYQLNNKYKQVVFLAHFF